MSSPAASPDLFGHPRGLSVLFAVGLWEVFAIAGMRAALIYYLVKQLGFGPGRAVEVYSLATGACTIMGLPGSVIADRWLGPTRAIVGGAVIMAVASIGLAVPALLYPALGLMAVGNGLFKSPMVAQVGALYAASDPRRDRAFVIYKVGTNLGSLAAPLVCGAIGTAWGWNRAFLAAGVGMGVAAAIFALSAGTLAPARPRAATPESSPAAEGNPVRGHPLVLLALVWAGSVLFWATYRQLESTVALWADQSVRRTLPWGNPPVTFPAAWFLALNPLLIFAFAPIVTRRWAREGASAARNELAWMGLGCAQLAAAFGLLGLVAAFAHGAIVAPGWLALAIALLTLGELHLDPVGQALFSRKALRGYPSLFVSLWFLTSSAGFGISAILGAWWGRLAAAPFFALAAGIALTGGGLIGLARRVGRIAISSSLVS